MNIGGWQPDFREPLDSIDLAYLKHDFPLMIVSAAPGEADRKELMSLLKRIGNHGVVVPQHFAIEFLGPGTAQHPWELSRWADDGGRV